MIAIDRKLRLQDLEIFRFFKNDKVLSYVIIEDTRGTFTEEDKKLDPLCLLGEEDLNEIVNVFIIYLLTDEPLDEGDSIMLKECFGNLVNISSNTNFIIKEYIQNDLYDQIGDSWDSKKYQRMLDVVGSNYIIPAIDEKNWLNLSQDKR